LFFGFAVTVTLGLALGSWYVGLRIVAANQVAPPTGIYLQVAGLGPEQGEGFMKALQAQGWNARIQPQQVQSGDEGNARVLIGPFATQAEMEQARRRLQSAGVLTNETAY
jgi:cell division protein FtsN